MSNDENVNEIKCEYYVPMGKPGAFIIKAPVVLSNLKISIPINQKIDLNKNCTDIQTTNNKVFLKSCKLNSNGKLSINGSLCKSLKYSISDLDKSIDRDKDIDILISTNINIDPIPMYEGPNSESFFYQKPKPIDCNLDSIEIIKDSILNSSSQHYIQMIICFNLTLTQVQNVFIPEPEGNFILLSDNSKICSLDNINTNNSYYVVGYDQSKGLIANKVDSNI